MITSVATKVVSETYCTLSKLFVTESSIYFSSLLALLSDSWRVNSSVFWNVFHYKGVDLRVNDNIDNDSTIGATPNTTKIQEVQPKNEKMSVSTTEFLIAVVVLITLVGALLVRCYEPKSGRRKNYASGVTTIEIMQDQDGGESVDDDESESSAKSLILLHRIYQPQDHNQLLA
jgi:hypothetical protein